MKEDIKNRWIAALESGKYLQGKDWLKYEDTNANKQFHCCLGVLCELAIEDNVLEASKLAQGESKYSLKIHSIDDSTKTLPIKVRDWAEMQSIDGGYIHFKRQTLAALNDSGKTFKEIAETIKAFWPEL